MLILANRESLSMFSKHPPIIFMMIVNLPNGLRYPLGVGRENAVLTEPTASHRKLLENAPTPTSRVHAVLGGAGWEASRGFLDETKKEIVIFGVLHGILRYCYLT